MFVFIVLIVQVSEQKIILGSIMHNSFFCRQEKQNLTAGMLIKQLMDLCVVIQRGSGKGSKSNKYVLQQPWSLLLSMCGSLWKLGL